VRNLLRRPARFGLTVGLLATGGALFMTALAVSLAWERNLDSLYSTRHYDVEARFNAPEGAQLGEALSALDGVKTLERWGAAPAAFARVGRVDVVRTYPDRGHGSLWAFGVPPATTLITFPLLAGRWLEPGDEHGVVLNHVARAQSGGAKVGDEVLLSIDGAISSWSVVGIVEEIGSPAIAYTTDLAFARATGTGDRRRMVRLASRSSSPPERTALIRRLEDTLAQRGTGVEWVVPFTELRTAIGDHVVILIRALVALAFILAVVGLLGLTSAVGVSVLERSKEIGVLKAIGATPARVRSLLLTESLLTALTSWVVAVAASLPLTFGVETLIGNLGFLAPLPFVLSVPAMLGWLALVLVATVLATLPPVQRATAMSVREALAET
jgi:putative ABC transport system permease protein